MRDRGLNKGLVQEFETSNKRIRGLFYGFRKMFWDYLAKLHVGFYDPCCPEAAGTNVSGVRMNMDTGVVEFWDPADQTWKDVAEWESTTTTTTAAPTTTTTTTTP